MALIRRRKKCKRVYVRERKSPCCHAEAGRAQAYVHMQTLAPGLLLVQRLACQSHPREGWFTCLLFNAIKDENIFLLLTCFVLSKHILVL